MTGGTDTLPAGRPVAWYGDDFTGSAAAAEVLDVAFIDAHNENPKPYRWVKSADEILASVQRFCQKTRGIAES